jgi:hypothetical protein
MKLCKAMNSLWVCIVVLASVLGSAMAQGPQNGSYLLGTGATDTLVLPFEWLGPH